MDAEPSEEKRSSIRDVLVYGSILALIMLVVLAPGFLYPPYFRVVKTSIILVVGLDFTRRVIMGAHSFGEAENPGGDHLEDVSIIIPAYNEANVLEGAVEACMNLDYPDDRYNVLISYEDSSTDNTPELAESLSERYDNVRALKSEDPGGKAKAVNFGLEKAEGDIIVGIDADHEFEEEALRRGVRWFSDEDVACVRGRGYGRNPEGSLISLHATIEMHLVERISIFGSHKFGGFCHYGGGQFFLRREVFDDVGKLGEDILVEDIDMSAKLHKNGKKMVVDPQVVTYEQHPEELANWWSQRVRWSRGWIQVARRHLKDIVTSDKMSTRKKVDASLKMSMSFAPLLLFMMIPMYFISSFLQYDTSPLFLSESLVFGASGLANLLLIAGMLVKDRVEGRPHNRREYLSVLTLGYYYTIGGLVTIKAIIDEFILSKGNTFVVTKKHKS